MGVDGEQKEERARKEVPEAKMNLNLMKKFDKEKAKNIQTINTKGQKEAEQAMNVDNP